MFTWAKATLASVAGTAEPIYGPEALHSVSKQTSITSYTELSRKDFTWTQLDSTCVETQIFYITATTGHLILAQIIYSNVAGLRITCQFNCKVFYPKSDDKPALWSSDQLSNIDFSEDKTNFYADDCAVELSEDGTQYTIKSAVNKASIVNLTITKLAPAFQVGTDGKTLFGTDPEQPWGSMRHAFWPRNQAEGTIITEDGTLDCKGHALFIMCLQGMKPHHAAARWTFANFQGPQYSAVMMEFTTPPSYATSTINVGAIVKDKEIIFASAAGTAKHTKIKPDTEIDWPEPEAVELVWTGKTKEDKEAKAMLDGSLGERVDRVDVMAEVPGFVKTIIKAAAGTKPYIYQYFPPNATLKVTVGDEEVVEEGMLFSEATFITET